MPVFSRLRDGALVLTVDGDFTANEIRRVAFGAFEADETPPSIPVLLDMSGAAGVATKTEEELRAVGAIFGAYRDRVAELAVVAAADVHAVFSPTGDFGRETGLNVQTCHSHAEAREWLGISGT
jgi:hypothetical protein